MSFGIGVLAKSEEANLSSISDTYYGRGSMGRSDELRQLVEDTKMQFPALSNFEDMDDLSWGMDYSEEHGCIRYYFGVRADSDMAFEFVLQRVQELNLILYDPQGNNAYIGEKQIF